ncbi:NisI/SpaI family lantibiotic immunity lipoprotein [Bacillus alkalicellulosilyticus]|uniref:NisI/SpaI family lantibiotic immunity lipoprotein n=1 Tax=Alkalihalobacterium alkalicellulosilyticum TaxID=1912214 RepID=UPI0009981C58|nr:NisI/SpaI family lantibiotic immunity lipoprotein [Bacillus alkalicellulosilyticus]
MINKKCISLSALLIVLVSILLITGCFEPDAYLKEVILNNHVPANIHFDENVYILTDEEVLENQLGNKVGRIKVVNVISYTEGDDPYLHVSFGKVYNLIDIEDAIGIEVNEKVLKAIRKDG